VAETGTGRIKTNTLTMFASRSEDVTSQRIVHVGSAFLAPPYSYSWTTPMTE
jgi:hypothetical protein